MNDLRVECSVNCVFFFYLTISLYIIQIHLLLEAHQKPIKTIVYD